MKKIITLLFCAALVSKGFAQERRDEGRNGMQNNERHDVSYGSNDHGNNSSYDAGYSVQNRTAEVNRDYDMRIAALSNDRSLRRSDRKRSTRDLSNERQERIRTMQAEYNRKGHDRDDDRGRDYSYNKKGW